MAIYLTADCHFGHQRILELCQRPYSSIDEMNADLVQRWNTTVGDRDTIWMLGDFAWSGSEDIFHRLNGQKHLVIGNHDTKRTLKLPWVSCHQYYELKLHTKIVLFHYPMEEWAGFFRGALHLHGHTHGRLPARPNRWDVGVDLHDFTPVALTQFV